MSVKTLMFLTSALATPGLIIEPLAANADGMSQLGTWECRRDTVPVSQI